MSRMLREVPHINPIIPAIMNMISFTSVDLGNSGPQRTMSSTEGIMIARVKLQIDPLMETRRSNLGMMNVIRNDATTTRNLQNIDTLKTIAFIAGKPMQCSYFPNEIFSLSNILLWYFALEIWVDDINHCTEKQWRTEENCNRVGQQHQWHQSEIIMNKARFTGK